MRVSILFHLSSNFSTRRFLQVFDCFCSIVRIVEFLISLNEKNIPTNNSKESQCKCGDVFAVHLEELPVFLKIILARTTIARFCQKVKDTLNQDKISPSNHASNKMLTVTRTMAAKITPTAVEVFIDQTARAAEGISTGSGATISSYWCIS